MMGEYESEPIRGLPEIPPDGERVIWQGSPRWQSMAKRVFHIRKIGAYFALLIIVYAATTAAAGEAASTVVAGIGWQVSLGLASLAILALLAWLYARTTCYTITNRRLVMRFGVAIPMMINIPLEKVDAADARDFADGTGDILLTLAKGERVSYWMLWPNIRPWHFSQVQPMLRSLPNAAAAVSSLSSALMPEKPKSERPNPSPRAQDVHFPARSRAAAAI